MKKKSQIEVKKIFSDYNCELIGEYLGYKYLMDYRCSCGKIGSISLEKFQRRIKRQEGCAYCNKHEWTIEEDEILKNMYGKEPRKNIIEKLNVTYSAIKSRAFYLGLQGNRSVVISKARKGKGKKYSYDNDFFETKVPDSAYWAGYIACNGRIDIKKQSVLIESREIKHLQKFQDLACHTGTIIRLDNKNKYLLSFCSSDFWIQSLAKNYNIHNDKKNLGSPTELSKSLKASYIFGYLNGDKCSFKNSDKKSFIKFFGSQCLLLWIKEVLDDLCPPFYGSKIDIKQNKYQKNYEAYLEGIRAKFILEKLQEHRIK